MEGSTTAPPHALGRTSDVARFASAIARLAGLVLLLALFVVLCPPGNDYFAAYGDKLAKLEASSRTSLPGGPRRLVLVGGSGMAFGPDGGALERTLERPVLNLGLHAGLGLEFLLAHAEPHLVAGDVVAVVPEYGTLDDAGVIDEGLQAAALLGGFPTALRFATTGDVPAILRGFPDFALHALIADRASAFRVRRAGGYVYSRAGFDARGDEVGHLTAPKPDVPLRMTIAPDVAEHVARLAEWSRRQEARGVRVVRLYPTIPDAAARENRAALERIAATIARSDGPFEGTPFEATLPERAFFDTPNHLAAEGVPLATARLGAQLEAALRAPR